MAYELNEHIFDTWTEESAYILGYFFADASINRGKGNRSDVIISSSRLEIMVLIKELIGAGHPIKPTGNDGYQMRIGSRALMQSLEVHGLRMTKNETVYPDIPLAYEAHFIRGYFDGKGSFLVDHRRTISNFSGCSIGFIEGLRDRLIMYGLGYSTLHWRGHNRTSCQIRYYVRDTRRLYHLLYDEARVYSSEQRARYEGGNTF